MLELAFIAGFVYVVYKFAIYLTSDPIEYEEMKREKAKKKRAKYNARREKNEDNWKDIL